MNKNSKLLLQALRGHITKQNPVWFMRQAGRYLPEYQQIRKQASGFLDLCLTPEWATEITLQPIKRFELDAAIVFSDILMVPYSLSQNIDFIDGEGPRLDPVQEERALANLHFDEKKIEPVFETLQRVKTKLDNKTALIGFCGGLWTVACYMIEGSHTPGFKKAMMMVEHQPEFLKKMMDILHEATVYYVSKQIEAGAEVIQIFESWAGLLQHEKFRQWVIEPTRNLVQAIEAKYPNVPIIGFPRGATPADYFAFVNETGVDALGIDEKVPLNFAQKELKEVKPLQGNLDPLLLCEGGDSMRIQVEHILDSLGPVHIFNLGHGIKPQTPLENVADLVRFVREIEWSTDENGGRSL